MCNDICFDDRISLDRRDIGKRRDGIALLLGVVACQQSEDVIHVRRVVVHVVFGVTRCDGSHHPHDRRIQSEHLWQLQHLVLVVGDGDVGTAQDAVRIQWRAGRPRVHECLRTCVS